MTERVAIVGPRQGADLDQVIMFCHNLHRRHPDTIVVSGGAEGVDRTAEQTWLSLGGIVWSYRPRKVREGEIVIDKWELGGTNARFFQLVEFPAFADYPSANWFRSWLIASEIADRVVAFYGHGHQRGTEFTVYVAEGHLPDAVYVYKREERDDSE